MASLANLEEAVEQENTRIGSASKREDEEQVVSTAKSRQLQQQCSDSQYPSTLIETQPQQLLSACGLLHASSSTSTSTSTLTPTTPTTPATIADLITVLITTSPSPLHPSTQHIEKVMESLCNFAPSLESCRKLVVCDGCLVRDKNKFRSGRVTQEAYDRYVKYKAALVQLFANGGKVDTPCEGQNYELLELKERQGFGFAVRAAMFDHVHTPMVFVVQHDRTLMRHVDLPSIVSTMEHRPDTINYVLLPLSSTDAYAQQWQTKLGQAGFKGAASDIRQFAIEINSKEQATNGEHEQHLLPCLKWYDSTHLAYSHFYRNIVFSKELQLVAKGGFIEDKLGQKQRQYYLQHGVKKAINFWKMWIFQDDAPNVVKMVAHLDGSSGGYSTAAMLAAKQKREAHIFETE